MIALQGDFAYSFIAGVLAAVNPCGFVLLPTYLIYFLGMEASQPDSSQRASLGRALRVGIAVSSGFVLLFIVVGVITRIFSSAIQDNAKYFSFAIGLGLIVFGVAMLTGWKPSLLTPQIQIGRDRSLRSMFIFGLAYAVASIGCTIGLLTTVVLGSVGKHGFITGVISISLYGLGMALLVTSLTLTLAAAHGGLLRVLRHGLRYMDTISGVFVIITGAYLTLYWWDAITEKTSANNVVSKVDSWQSRVATFLKSQGAPRIAVICSVIVLGAILYLRTSRKQSVSQ